VNNILFDFFTLSHWLLRFLTFIAFIFLSLDNNAFTQFLRAAGDGRTVEMLDFLLEGADTEHVESVRFILNVFSIVNALLAWRFFIGFG
jgi:hypothetical protein